jgi:DNA-binding response OmpR family regulator
MKSILLIEPNTLLAQTYTAALQHNGYNVTVAYGAQTAIDEADKQTPDLVIVELQLAAHGGIEFLHEFRSYAEWQSIPVIVNTLVSPAHVASVRAALINELGVCAVLYKPRTSLQQLLRHVRDNLLLAV